MPILNLFTFIMDPDLRTEPMSALALTDSKNRKFKQKMVEAKQDQTNHELRHRRLYFSPTSGKITTGYRVPVWS
jgi:hypothetical protein